MPKAGCGRSRAAHGIREELSGRHHDRAVEEPGMLLLARAVGGHDPAVVLAEAVGAVQPDALRLPALVDDEAPARDYELLPPRQPDLVVAARRQRVESAHVRCP